MVSVRRLGLVLAALLWTVPAAAQQGTGTINGRVVDSTTQRPLPGVTVRIPQTTRGALTRDDGSFTLAGVPAGPTAIRATRIGYAAQQQAVTVLADAPVTVNFTLRQVAAALTEVVVTGYGTQRREAITGSVATVNADEANVGVAPNVNNLIQGRAPGVTIIQNSGEPGAGAQVRVRGGTSISASNEPLYVIDGVPIQNTQTEATGLGIGGTASLARSPLNLLNPSDISTITVLKDASATAIYGSRGANGVVLIETKKGAAGTTQVEYEGYLAASSPSSTLDVLNGNEYRSFVQEQVALYQQDTTKGLPPTRLATLGTANTDWEDQLTRTGVTQNHNLAFSGGSQTTQYRASLNFMDQEGVVISNGFQRYQGRLNGTTRALGDKLQLGLNLTTSQIRNKYLPFENTGGFEGAVFVNMVTFNPTQPVMTQDPVTGGMRYYEVGTGSQSLRNPVALAEQIDDKARTTRTLGNLQAAYTILPSLVGSVNVGVDRSSGVRQTYLPAANPVGAGTNGRARQVDRDLSNQTLQTLLTYTRQFGVDHQVDWVGGYEYSKFRLSEFGAEARNFLTDAFSFNNLGGGATLVSPYSGDTSRVLASFFTRANYGFRNRYFITGVVRRDGSSVFGANNRWAVFPAVSASWRISEEAFMKNVPVSFLRLRAGYGLQGNQGVQPYGSLTLLGTDPGARYIFGNTLYTGVTPSQNANPNLKWETTAQTNFAVDYGLLGSRLTGTLEYYVKNTRDLLLKVNVPQPAPISDQLQNIGSVRNVGFEASADYEIINRLKHTWTAGLVMSVERNKVVELGGGRQFISTGDVSGQGQSDQDAQRILVGEPLGTFWGPEFVGVDAQGKQLFNKYQVTRDASGRVTSRSRVGTTTSPGGDDFVILGDANPSMTLGLRSQVNWGAFDGSFLIRAVTGAKAFNNTALVYATKGNALQDKNFLRSALNDKIGIKEPAIYSSRYVEDADFFRLQNVTLGYTLGVPLLGGGTSRRPSTVRFYVSGDNLLVATPYSGYDPEVHADAGLATRGIDYLSYPRARTFTGGVRVGF